MAASENIGPVKRLDIILENSHKLVYYPNQFVEGHVLLEVAEHMSSRGVYLTFCGCGGVYWREDRTGRLHRCVDTVTFESSEEYFRIQERLQEERLLAPGVFKFLFKFKLPSKLPENYQDNIGHIEYFLDARLKIDNHRRNDVNTKKPFTVVNPLDLNTLIIPDVTLPVQRQQSQTVGYALCRSAPIRGHFRAERGGYVPGETIMLGADIENGTRRTIRRSFVRLMQETLYHTEEKTQEYTEELARVTKGAIPPGHTYEWVDVPLVFPAKHTVFNVGPSNIITIRYVLELVIEPRWAKKPIILPLQLTMGAVKLKHKTKTTLPHDRLHSAAQGKRLTSIAEFISVRGESRDVQRGNSRATDISRSPRGGQDTNTPRSRDGRRDIDIHPSGDGRQIDSSLSIDRGQTGLSISQNSRDTDTQQSLNDVEADVNTREDKTNDTLQSQDDKPTRLRKKARHKRVAPSDLTDTRNYITEIVEMREREKSFTRGGDGTPSH